MTSYYVDDKYKLNSKVIAFCELKNSHIEMELSGKVFGVLKDR